MEVRFKPWLVQSLQTGWSGTPAAPARSGSPRPEPRSPRAFDTIGIHLKTALGLSNEVGPPHHEFRSKLVMSHRVFFTIDEDAMAVHIIDFVHTARQTKLDEYTG